MRAAGEFALPDVRLELRKRILQILGKNQIHLLGLKRGEAGRVRDVAAAFDRVQLHMTGGMLAAADLVRNRTDLSAERAVKTVEHARLADTELPANALTLPRMRSRSASMPSPVFALTRSTSMPLLR